MANLENINSSKDRMGLVQALLILHTYRDFCMQHDLDSQVAPALDVIFEWIDNMVLLLHKIGGSGHADS